MRCARAWRPSKQDLAGARARGRGRAFREIPGFSDGAGMANIKADEISKILREQIANYEQTVSVDEVGAVISVGDGIARVHGLEKVMAGGKLAFPPAAFGIALNPAKGGISVGAP